MSTVPERVWVLMGGVSSEREVSLRTGRGVAEALRKKSYKVESFDVRPGSDLLNLDWTHPPDIVFIALHGPFGEDGTLQGFLEALQIPYVGSGVGSSSLCMHKGLSRKQFAQFGIPHPKGFEFEGEVGLEDFLESSTDEAFFKRKYFIKAAREGSTIGIERFNPAQSPHGRADFVSLCKKSLKFDSYLVVEEWIEGPEVTVPVLFGKAMPVVEIRPLSQFYDFQSKYTAGKTEYICPAEISDDLTRECQRLAEKVFKVLECEDYGRVDIMLAKEGPKVLEMNTLPGMTETSLVPKSARAAGLSYEDFCDQLIKGSYAEQNGTKRA